MVELDSGYQGFVARFKATYDNGGVETGRIGALDRLNWEGSILRVPSQ